VQRHPRLSRELAATLALSSDSGIEIAPSVSMGLPEKVVQFGTGAFLRGFAEYFVDAANREGRFNGSIVAVSSTGSSRDAVLNEQDGLFTLAIQGLDGAEPRQRFRLVSSLSRALTARDDWPLVLELAREPAIELVISNTTEIGIARDPSDAYDDAPPKSFPAKLTRFLAERATHFACAPSRGLVVLPCELIEENGGTLRGIVLELARLWSLDSRVVEWIEQSVIFANTLVDRIVPGAPAADEVARIERVFGYRDGLMTACEPYALFAIEGNEALRRRLGFPGDDSRIIVEPDIRPYRERKVRVLNGAHTISVPVALLAGLETVSDAVADPRLGAFIRRCVFDEIVPGLDAPNAEGFARDAMARFANPFIRHGLIDITLHQTAKMRVRVVPSILAYTARMGRVPPALAFGFAAYVAFMRGEVQTERRASGLPVPDDREGEMVRAAWHRVNLTSDDAVARMARNVVGNVQLWGAELAALDEFGGAVADQLVRILRDGLAAALEHHLTEAAATT
jgi:tagaturonate reductase